VRENHRNSDHCHNSDVDKHHINDGQHDQQPRNDSGPDHQCDSDCVQQQHEDDTEHGDDEA